VNGLLPPPERPGSVAVRADDIALGCLGQDSLTPARPIRRVTPVDFAAESRWSKSIAHGGKERRQSAQGTSRNRSSSRAWSRHRFRRWARPGDRPTGLAAANRLAWRSRVRTRWQFAQTMSHFAASAISTFEGLSMARPAVRRNAFVDASR
jgi:hypothetical protein